jgi:hypothetical protein
MFDLIKDGFINWADGMKISQSHFHDLQKAIDARVKDSRAVSLRSDNFGIIPSLSGETGLDIDLRVDDKENLKIKVRQCRAISPAGDRIEILTNSLNTGQNDFDRSLKLDQAVLSSNKDLLVSLRANREDVHLYGQPDQEESPARMPFVESALNLEVFEVGGDNQDLYKNAVVIAKLQVQNGEVSEDENYIPPCTVMQSHQDLSEFAFKYVQFLGNLEDDLFKIMKNVSGKEQLTTLAVSVSTLARGIILTIQQEIDAIRMFSKHFTPSLYVLNAKKIARCIKNVIELNSNDRKEELLNYVQEVIDINPGEYMTVNSRILDMDYNHYQIRESLHLILQFCKINGKLIAEWANLDYIGKKKKTGIFVGEVSKDNEVTKERKKWDF